MATRKVQFSATRRAKKSKSQSCRIGQGCAKSSKVPWCEAECQDKRAGSRDTRLLQPRTSPPVTRLHSEPGMGCRMVVPGWFFLFLIKTPFGEPSWKRKSHCCSIRCDDNPPAGSGSFSTICRSLMPAVSLDLHPSDPNPTHKHHLQPPKEKIRRGKRTAARFKMIESAGDIIAIVGTGQEAESKGVKPQLGQLGQTKHVVTRQRYHL